MAVYTPFYRLAGLEKNLSHEKKNYIDHAPSAFQITKK